MLHRLIRHISPLALVAIMMAVVSGCTHNNGDIGPLFGSWTLQAANNVPFIFLTR